MTEFVTGDLVTITKPLYETTRGACGFRIAQRQQGEVIGRGLHKESLGVYCVQFSYRNDDGGTETTSTACAWFHLTEWQCDESRASEFLPM